MSIEDLIEAVVDTRPRDLVKILWDNPHARVCKQYRPHINKHGTVYCDPCGITVETINDISSSFCPRCECPVVVHNCDTGKCYKCGKECGLISESE